MAENTPALSEADEIKRLKDLNARYLVMARDAQVKRDEVIVECRKWQWLAEGTEQERLRLKRELDELGKKVRYAIESLDRLVVNRNYYAEDIIASVLGDLETALDKSLIVGRHPKQGGDATEALHA